MLPLLSLVLSSTVPLSLAASPHFPNLPTLTLSHLLSRLLLVILTPLSFTFQLSLPRRIQRRHVQVPPRPAPWFRSQVAEEEGGGECQAEGDHSGRVLGGRGESLQRGDGFDGRWAQGGESAELWDFRSLELATDHS